MSGRPLVAGWTHTGTSHTARGRGPQDAFLALPGPAPDTLVLAVADGAGARERSALGARLAVDVACRILARDVPDTGEQAAVWRDRAQAAGQTVAAEFQRCAEVLAPEDPAELATTLAAALVRGPWAVLVAVGDCFGAVLTEPAQQGSDEKNQNPDNRRGAWHLVLPPGTSAWLPSASRSDLRAFALWDPELSGILLATDGCTPLALERPGGLGLPDGAGPQPAPAFFDAVAHRVRADGGGSAALADLLRAGSADRSADDITVLCALTGGR